MARVIGMLGCVLVVGGLAGGYAGKAQEAATLEDRVAALETQVDSLRAASLPPTTMPGMAPDWEGNGFQVLCDWLPVEGQDAAGSGELLYGTCVRVAETHR